MKGTIINLTEANVAVVVLCEPEEDMPVRGNAMASGDDAVDAAAEKAIIADLAAGNEWAWCTVRVQVSWTAPSGRVYHANDYLGGCSYKDEADFRADSYYADMVARALDMLNTDLRTTYADLAAAPRDV
jgi:hypothetical protein